MAPPARGGGGAAAAQRVRGLAAHVVAARGAAADQRPPPSAAVPVGFDLVPSEEDPAIAAHLRWLQQKDALGQDALLLGPPGALRRQLALRYCELTGREAEVLTVTRDTTEADLKQRRELSTGPGGTCTVYADGAPVRCALKGRVLILDGIEKAERNVLPTLNNLLENREMALDDGRFLVPARRYDALASAAGAAGAAGLGRLARVHPDFRVIALALPCPPFVGNPLDPPLRSRFQARVVSPPLLAAPSQLRPLGASVPEALLRRLAAAQRALNAHALGGEAAAEALAEALPPGARPPVLSHDALLRVLRLVSGAGVLPEGCRPALSAALARAYPLDLLSGVAAGAGAGSRGSALREAAAQWLRHFQLDAGDQGGQGALELREGGAATSAGDGAGHVLVSLGSGEPVRLPSPCLPRPPPGAFVDLPQLRRLSAAIAQDLAVGHDCVLAGPPGCGKSALARRLAALLGYGAPGGSGIEFFFLYEEMSSRDLLQRRTTDAGGRTSWVDSPLVRAARSGAVCILDGMHRLRGDVLCALAPLLQDRQASLSVANDPLGAEAELLLRQDRYEALRHRLSDAGSYDEQSNCRVARIHPSFRVLALAELPTARAPWLTEELSTCFSHHAYPELEPGDVVRVLASLFPRLQEAAARRLVAACAPPAATGAAAPPAVEPQEAWSGTQLRVLIRVARRAAAAEEAAVDSELLAGILQQALFPFLPPGERAELLGRLRGPFGAEAVAAAAARAGRGRAGRGGGQEGSASAPPELDPGADGAGARVKIGSFWAPRGAARRPELVPDVAFVGIGRHAELLEELARAMLERGERHLLLLGPQGVGKNRVVDHLLQALNLEREYMQLHRDTSVAQLTATPQISDGRLLYEDSPLVRAAEHGRVLVLDEADKAPLEVVVVLKSLVEDGQLALPDGRRLALLAERGAPGGGGGASAPPAAIPIHPSFRMLVLANKPGFPFLGNDLLREADVFSVFCLDNPDAASELQLVRTVGPNVPEALLRTLVGIFADLRAAVEGGQLQYPYSTRELLAVVRHLEGFPDDPLEAALSSVLAFDRFDAGVREVLRPIFERRGVPVGAALGAPAEDGGSPELQQPWLRALAVLRGVTLGATARLRASPCGSWRASPAEDLPFEAHDATARPALLDPPQAVPLAALAFDRVGDVFSESVARVKLPMASRAGPVVDAAAMLTDDAGAGARGRVLHLLSTRPLSVWSVEDPLGAGAGAGRCSALVLGYGADWALGAPEAGAHVVVNGREVPLGSAQLAAVPGERAVLLHSPLDPLAPQLLLERPHREDVRAVVLATPALTPAARSSRVRPDPREAFVAVPVVGAELEAGAAAAEGAFAPANCVVFFQPSGRRLVQLDVARRCAREVALGEARGPGRQLHRGPRPSVAAAATERGVEVLVCEEEPAAEGASAAFLAVLFPSGPASADGAPRPPTARWVEAHPAEPAWAGAARERAPAAGEAAALPVLAADGLFTTPFGTAEQVTFAALGPGGGVAHELAGGRREDGSRAVAALREGAAAPSGLAPAAAPPTLAQLAKAEGKSLRQLLGRHAAPLPSPRRECLARDAAAPPGLLARALELPASAAASGDWVEAVHASSRTLRRLPARDAGEADADLGAGARAGVARLVPWPAPAAGASPAGGAQPDLCVVFRDGSVRWLEMHPERLAASLREFLEVRGLRGLLQEGGPGGPGGAAEEGEGAEDEDEEGEDEAAEEAEEGAGGGRRGARRAAAGARRGRAGEPPAYGSPEQLRAQVIRQARRQRRRLLEASRREEHQREQSRDASGKPKHGDEDDKEHVGGNRWAGGSGGADTAGLGGKGGPYRLEKPGQNVHQISDEAKAQISEEAREAARKMGEEAREKRLQEIEMGGGDYDLYMTILGEVQGEVDQLRRVLGAATAKERERVWHRGAEGELDENRLVDAIAGEAAVFKRRAAREQRPGEAPQRPKRITFLFDASASMYRFNGMDGRLRRSCEAAVMLMEALRGFEQRFDYEVCCHDGDNVLTELVPFGRPPADEKERLKVISKMMTAAQYCGSGDNTLAAIERACERIEASGPADDYFVFAFSDANFARYGISPQALGRTLARHRSVNAVCFFIATFEDEALLLARHMPDRVKLCLDLKALPAEIRQQFVSSVSRGRAAL